MFSRFNLTRVAAAAGLGIVIAACLLAVIGIEPGSISASVIVSVVAFVALCLVGQVWAAVTYGEGAGVWLALLLASSPAWLGTVGVWRFQLAVVLFAWVVARIVRLAPDPTLMGCVWAGVAAGCAARWLPVGPLLFAIAAVAALWRASHPLHLEYSGRVVRSSAMALLVGTATAAVVAAIAPWQSATLLPSPSLDWIPLAAIVPALVRPWRRHRRAADVVAISAVVGSCALATARGWELAVLGLVPLAMLAAAAIDYRAGMVRRLLAWAALVAQLLWAAWSGPVLSPLIWSVSH